MGKTSKIISIILTVAMLMGLMTSVSFAAQTLPTTFGWSTDNAGYITIDVPAFDGEEVEYYLDLYKDGVRVNHDFGVFFDAGGTQESEVFTDKINELGDGTYKYKIGFSRDFDTDELVNPTAFSSEYVKSSNEEPSDLPYDLTWDSAEKGSIQFKVPAHIEGRVKYEVVLYKGNEKVADTTLSLWGNTLDESRIMSHGCMADDIYDNGSGVYKYTLSTLDSRNNVLETTDFSSEFNYIKPSATLPVPAGIVMTESEVRWTPISNDCCGGYWVDFYVAYPNGEKFWVYGQEVRGQATDSFNYLEDNDVATYSSQQIDRMYGINAAKYPKESAFLAITLQSLTADMLLYNSSDISEYVSILDDENNDDDTSEELATGKAGETATWALSNNGVLTLSGTGAVSELEEFTYKPDVKSVIIGDGITSIGDYVLNDLNDCESVEIGKGTTTLGEQFMYGSKLKEIVLPVNVTEIKEGFCGNKQNTLEKIYVYNKNLTGCEYINAYSYMEFISTVYGYTGSTIESIADEREYNFVSIDPDFTINDGANETTDKNVKIRLNDYAKKDFVQYKINDGAYKNITNTDIDLVLDINDGEKTITITFKNESYEIAKTHRITFNNKHKITFEADGRVVDEQTFGCGATLPAIDGTNAPAKDGYIFLKWDTLPEIMPDNDFTVNAVYMKSPEDTSLDSILTEEEKAEGISVQADVSVINDNANIQTALTNNYSEYTASIMLDIEINKVKEGDDTYVPVNIAETTNLLAFTVDIPTDIQGKDKYIVLREHDGAIDALTTSENADGEYIEVGNNAITIYAKKFSAYMLLGKDAEITHHSSGGGSSSYTVKFDTNGAGTVKSQIVRKNNLAKEPDVPTKDGLTFDGWYSDKELTTKFDFTTKITKSITLYAKWKESPKHKIILTIGQKEALVNGETISNDVAPKIVNERTMLPIRFIAEKLGAKVEWVGETRTVIVELNDIKISLVIGESFATVNDEEIELDSPSFIEDGRTFLPIRFVMENLGADVLWHNDTQTVTITK